ncbi:MAG: YraN family protein [Defluviicoccus sp.]
MVGRPHPDRRRAAQRFGRLAELAARALLRLKGYRILAYDLRTPVGEIDIVARRGAVVAFVEVKSRARAPGADSLSPAQRRRIVRAAEAFLSRQRDPHLEGVRFDLMLMAPWRWPRHIPNAWRADD